MPDETPRGLARSISGVLWTGFGSFGAMVISVGSAVIVTRHLGPAGYGQYSFLTWLAETAGALATLGLARPVARFTAPLHRSGAIGRARRLTTRAALVAAVTGASLGLAFAALVGRRWGDPLPILLPSSISALAVSTTLVCTAGLHGTSRFREAASIALTASFLLLVATASVALIDGGPLMQFSASTMASLAGAVLAVRFVLESKNLPAESADVDERSFPDSFRGYWFAAAALLLIETIVWQRCEVFFLERYRPVEDVGFYTAAFAIAGRLGVLPAIFAPVLYASIARLRSDENDERERMRVIYRAATRWMAMLCVPIFCVAAALSASLLQLLFGNDYEPSTPALLVLLVGALLPALSIPGAAVMYGTDRMGFVLLWGAVAATITLSADALLIPPLGVTGAAFGNVSGQSVAVLVTVWLGLRPKGFVFPMKSVGICLAAGAAGALAAVAAEALVQTSFSVFIAAPTGIVVYLLVLRGVRFFDWTDLQLLDSVRASAPVLVKGPLDGLRGWLVPKDADDCP